jgi:hypothetical protein
VVDSKPGMPRGRYLTCKYLQIASKTKAMVLRAYLAGITNRHGLSGCITSSSARVQFHPCFHRATRGYAAASASLTKKTPVAAKGTRKDARTQPQPSPRKSASRTPKKTPNCFEENEPSSHLRRNLNSKTR